MEKLNPDVPWRGGGDFADEVYARATIPETSHTWVKWDVTGLVQEWYEGTHPNYGLLIRDNLESWYPIEENFVVNYLSKEYYLPEFHPYLKITYRYKIDKIPILR